MKKTIRNLEPEQVSFRAFEEDGKRYLDGYASRFNQRSKQIFENNRLFYEIISRTAFDETLQSENLNVVSTFNHNRDRGILGRTKSGTLALSTDDVGLHFKVEVPLTQLGNDVYTLVQRGDLSECSFAFIVKKGDDEWTKDENGDNIRTINKIAKLYDVSVVIDGAYEHTDVFARDEVEENIEPSPGDDKDEFISKCIKYVMDNGETDDTKQAYAICASKWDNRTKSDPSDEELEILSKDVEINAAYPWDTCIQDQLDKGYSEESATKICAYIKNKNRSEKINQELEHMRYHIQILKLK